VDRPPLLSALGRRVRRFGPRYLAAEVGLRAARRVGERMEDALLDIEGERGVFGPANRAWRDSSARENRERWNRWDWSRMGVEWTASEEWKQALVDEVLLPTIPPGGTVVEIGPGSGRWSVIVQPRAERLVLVGVSRSRASSARSARKRSRSAPLAPRTRCYAARRNAASRQLAHGW
jgi:hypothetical protein